MVKDRDRREPLSDDALQKLKDRDIWIIIMLLNVLFVQAGNIALIPMSCTQVISNVCEQQCVCIY